MNTTVCLLSVIFHSQKGGGGGKLSMDEKAIECECSSTKQQRLNLTSILFMKADYQGRNM